MEILLTFAVIVGGLTGLLVCKISSLANLSSISILGLVFVLFAGGTFGFQRHIWGTMAPNDPAWDGPAWLLSWVFALGATSVGLIVFAITFALARALQKTGKDH